MTREEAIKELEEIAEMTIWNYRRLATTMAIEALSAEADWIPVSERLPKEYAQYLVCFKTGECYVYWLEDSDWSRSIIELEEIVAWMPLPEPYKGGESDG